MAKSLKDKFFAKQAEKYVQEQIDQIDKTPVNVAITGDSGSGKSTLINSLRGLKPNDPGSAKVGITETTMEPTPYTHPFYPSVVFWDLPGVGTPSNPKSDYKKKMKLKNYDFFLIIIANRFSENSLWLARVLTKLHKPFFFLRSKIDIDITMKKKHNPKITEGEIIKEIKTDIISNLQELSSTHEIFVVSGEIENIDRYDFPKLKQRIIQVLPTVKKNTLIVSLNGYAKELIEQKYEVLKKRIVYYAAASGITALAPIPGLSVSVDFGLLAKMSYDFTKAFGLTIEQIEGPYKRISKKTKVLSILGRVGALLTSKAIVKFVGAQSTSGVLEEFVRYVPIIGQIAAGALSFGATYQAGKVLLKELKKLALEMAEEVIELQVEETRFQEQPTI